MRGMSRGLQEWGAWEDGKGLGVHGKAFCGVKDYKCVCLRGGGWDCKGLFAKVWRVRAWGCAPGRDSARGLEWAFESWWGCIDEKQNQTKQTQLKYCFPPTHTLDEVLQELPVITSAAVGGALPSWKHHGVVILHPALPSPAALWRCMEWHRYGLGAQWAARGSPRIPTAWDAADGTAGFGPCGWQGQLVMWHLKCQN